jgi:hypothetical protein
MFVAPNGDFTATLAEAASGNPFAGFWTDLNPAAGGFVDITLDATSALVAWHSVPYFGETAANSFSIRFSPLTGQVTIGGLGGIVPNPLIGTSFVSGDAQLLGICNGSLGTTIANAPFPFGTTVAGGAGQGLVDFWSGAAATAPNGVHLVRTIQDNQSMGGLGLLDFTPVGGGYTALSH